MTDPLAKVATQAAIEYFVEKSMPLILDRLTKFARSVTKDSNPKEEVRNLPPSAIIGVGRCGSNIALEVAEMYTPHINAENTNDPSVKHDTRKKRRFFWIKTNTTVVKSIEPVILIADLDERTFLRVKRLSDTYTKLRPIDQLLYLQQGGGAGHLPIVGQYMGRILLNISSETDHNQMNSDQWLQNRTYFIDGAGSEANHSRLFFYIFSTGGGSGSGMTPEFGLAQQYSYLQKLRDVNDPLSIYKNSSKFYPICGVGVAILPTIEESQANNAVYLNTGRALCRYLAQEKRFSQEFNLEKMDTHAIRIFNGLLMVSNHVMKWLPPSDPRNKKDDSPTVADVQDRTNQYVAQQIFNLISAQASQPDNTNNRLDGIDPGDTIGLDANDLYNSLNGPIAIAYAETPVGKFKSRDILLRSISIPSKNDDTDALEGISILPIPKDHYERRLRDVGTNFQNLTKLPLFKCANALVIVISVPINFKLEERDIAEMRNLIHELFPNANIRRYALVKGSVSEKISFTIMISGSACTCNEVFRHILDYIGSCFLESSADQNVVTSEIINTVRAKKFDPTRISALLSDKENLSPVLAGFGGAGIWEVIKKTNEANFTNIITTSPLVPMDSVRLTKKDIIDALEYINIALNHGSKQRIVDQDYFSDDIIPTPIQTPDDDYLSLRP